MNGPPKILIGLLSTLALASCLSFKVKAPTPEGNHLELFEICRGVTETRETLAPDEPCTEFTEKDSRIYGFIKVRNAAGGIELRWKWYSPDKKLWKDTGEIAVSEGTEGLYSITAYDFLRTDDENIPQGEWTVAVFVNNVLAGRKTFRIVGSSARIRPFVGLSSRAD